MKQVGLVFAVILVGVASAGESEEEGKKYIDEMYKKGEEFGAESAEKQWAADTADQARKEETQKDSDELQERYDAYLKESLTKINTFPWKTFKDENTKRMFDAARVMGTNGLPADKKAELDKVEGDMKKINEAPLLKEFNGDGKPKLTSKDAAERLLKNYKNADEMNFYWKEWFDTVGKPKKDLFTRWMELLTEVAVMYGYENVAKYFQNFYEIDDFENKMNELYEQIKPLFKELHAYIRYKLWDLYGRDDNIVDLKGPIPASFLGPSWGQTPESLYEILEPFPNKPSLDIAQKLKDEGYSGKKMAETADKFYQSLGLSKMPEDFWKNSIFEKKGDITISGKIYYFDNGNFCRLIYLVTPTPTAVDLYMMHVLVGILQYQVEDYHLPYFFRTPPGPAFGKGVNKLITLLTVSPKYYQTLGLLDSNIEFDKEMEINVLLKRSLTQVFYFPWAYTYDRWRWEVSEGKISKENYNCQYWNLRIDLQGVEPPVDRDNSDFDIGDNSWYTTGGEYIQSYIGDILKYDMIRALCKDQTLAFCDINNNKEAGKKLKNMMSLGNSRPWYDALEAVTGNKNLDASGVLEYYDPLYKWLQEENQKNGVETGWNEGHNRCR